MCAPSAAFSLPRLSRRALGTLGAAYDEMRDALAGRNYVADYVQTLTHELKSPLSAIRGAAELLHEPSMPPPDRERFVANIERETARIQELVDRMMELAALESRRALERSAPVAMRALLEERVASAQATRARRAAFGSHCDASAEATVDGDALLLQRAVGNLLDNAIDFSPDGGHIDVTPRAPARRSLDISVRDHGPGIPDYADDKVFEKFYSLARPHSQRKSTGLGLPFVREIAELHGGRVTLRNADGGGAVAMLSLPRGSSIATDASAPAFMASSAHERTHAKCRAPGSWPRLWLLLGVAVFVGVQAWQSRSSAARFSVDAVSGAIELRRAADGHFHWPGSGQRHRRRLPGRHRRHRHRDSAGAGRSRRAGRRGRCNRRPPAAWCRARWRVPTWSCKAACASSGCASSVLPRAASRRCWAWTCWPSCASRRATACLRLEAAR